jgi:transcriptional regulator with PAS, ATPase and Fis domain
MLSNRYRIMIDWNKIVESNVIKTFREVCYDWWGMDVQFYDENGNSRSNNIAFQNPICHLINTSEKGKKCCLLCYKRNLKEFNNSHKPFKFECYAGLLVIAIPIFIKEKYSGALIGSGIRLSNTKGRRHKYCIWELTKLGIDRAAAEKCYNQLKRINGHAEVYALDFLKKIAKDVMTYSEKLQERIDLIENNKVIMKEAYNKKYMGIIGTSLQMKKTFETLDLIENSENPVLIEGETGTGKELISAAIHYNSSRRSKTYIIQNCSAFTETLLTSELFGHEKGAFTGAISDKRGLFQIADGGTLFLDEIGDMNIDIQAKLLRILEDGTYYSVGGTVQKKVDVRIIVATNKNLKDQVEKGLFRKDLFYRINAIPINLPPLRERKEDVIPLSNFFLESYAENNHEENKILSQEIIEQFMAYEWPGNIRELKNMIERLIMLSGRNKEIKTDAVPMDVFSLFPLKSHERKPKNDSKLRDFLQSYEKRITEDVLNRTHWNKTVASRELGISRASLNNKISQFHIQPSLH